MSSCGLIGRQRANLLLAYPSGNAVDEPWHLFSNH